MPLKNPFLASSTKFRVGQRRVDHVEFDLDRALRGVEVGLRRVRRGEQRGAPRSRPRSRPVGAGRASADVGPRVRVLQQLSPRGPARPSRDRSTPRRAMVARASAPYAASAPSAAARATYAHRSWPRSHASAARPRHRRPAVPRERRRRRPHADVVAGEALAQEVRQVGGLHRRQGAQRRRDTRSSASRGEIARAAGRARSPRMLPSAPTRSDAHLPRRIGIEARQHRDERAASMAATAPSAAPRIGRPAWPRGRCSVVQRRAGAHEAQCGDRLHPASRCRRRGCTQQPPQRDRRRSRPPIWPSARPRSRRRAGRPRDRAARRSRTGTPRGSFKDAQTRAPRSPRVGARGRARQASSAGTARRSSMRCTAQATGHHRDAGRHRRRARPRPAGPTPSAAPARRQAQPQRLGRRRSVHARSSTASRPPPGPPAQRATSAPMAARPRASPMAAQRLGRPSLHPRVRVLEGGDERTSGLPIPQQSQREARHLTHVGIGIAERPQQRRRPPPARPTRPTPAPRAARRSGSASQQRGPVRSGQTTGGAPRPAHVRGVVATGAGAGATARVAQHALVLEPEDPAELLLVGVTTGAGAGDRRRRRRAGGGAEREQSDAAARRDGSCVQSQ